MVPVLPGVTPKTAVTRHAANPNPLEDIIFDRPPGMEMHHHLWKDWHLLSDFASAIDSLDNNAIVAGEFEDDPERRLEDWHSGALSAAAAAVNLAKDPDAKKALANVSNDNYPGGCFAFKAVIMYLVEQGQYSDPKLLECFDLIQDLARIHQIDEEMVVARVQQLHRFCSFSKTSKVQDLHFHSDSTTFIGKG